MKKLAMAVLCLCWIEGLCAQESSSVYNFLKIPISAHAAALGGANVSLIEDDPTLAYDNPALLASVSYKTLNLNYMTYIRDSKVVSAGYVKALGNRHTFGISGQLFDYGKMDETSSTGETLGTFTAKDICISGLYSYLLSDYWVGGVTARFISSTYADYSSTAISFDVGLNYYDEDRDFSASLVLKNIGAQLSSFDEETEHPPFDVQLGVTHSMVHAPIRFSLTLVDLTRWSSHYYYNPDGEDKLGKKILNHMVVGVEFLPTDRTYLAVGYNFRRGNELKAAGSGHGAGLSFGGGLQLSRFKLGIAYAKYHIAASSLLFNVSYNL